MTMKFVLTVAQEKVSKCLKGSNVKERGVTSYAYMNEN